MEDGQAGRSRRSGRDSDVDPFYDRLFNILIAFVFCFIITVFWPDNDPNDIDTWVQDPAGNLAWFRQREAGLMHLDRDDRGVVGDTILVNGRELINPLNQEVATLRGFAPGEYTVNVQYHVLYRRQGGHGVGGIQRAVSMAVGAWMNSFHAAQSARTLRSSLSS